MKVALGYGEHIDEYGRTTVVETLTCAHCNRLFEKPKPGDPMGFCHMCFKPVCLRYGRSERCDPFERKLEEIERQGRFLRSMPIRFTHSTISIGDQLNNDH